MGYMISYHPFMTVQFEDDGGVPVSGFRLSPTPKTMQQMQMTQILHRPRANGLQLFYRSTSNSAPQLLGEINARRRFSFHIMQTASDVFARLLPDFNTGDGAALHFDNLDTAGAIQASGIINQGATVSDTDTVAMGSVPFPARVDLTAGVPTDVEVRDPISGTSLITVPVNAVAGATETTVLIDISGPGDGLYRAIASIQAALDKRIYFDKTGNGRVRGAIELFWETAQDNVPSPDGVVYRVVFQRR